jgi:hypothetical protein
MNEPPPYILIQNSKVLLYIEYKIRDSSYIQVVYIKCTRDLMATRREVSYIFDGQNAHTKISPNISEHDLLRAHHIHFSTYSKIRIISFFHTSAHLNAPTVLKSMIRFSIKFFSRSRFLGLKVRCATDKISVGNCQIFYE